MHDGRLLVLNEPKAGVPARSGWDRGPRPAVAWEKGMFLRLDDLPPNPGNGGCSASAAAKVANWEIDRKKKVYLLTNLIGRTRAAACQRESAKEEWASGNARPGEAVGAEANGRTWALLDPIGAVCRFARPTVGPRARRTGDFSFCCKNYQTVCTRGHRRIGVARSTRRVAFHARNSGSCSKTRNRGRRLSRCTSGHRARFRADFSGSARCTTACIPKWCGT